MWTPLTQDIFDALNGLMAACGLQGESGTEELYSMLGSACEELDAEGVLEESHQQGLCYDMNAALAHKLAKRLLGDLPRGH